MVDGNNITPSDGADRSVGHRIVRGTLVIMFMWAFWKLGGFLMYFLIDLYYGKGATGHGVVTDVFTAVYGPIIFLLFYSTVLKVFKPAFMPLFAQARIKRSEAEAWKLANTTLNLLLLLALGAGILTVAFTPEIVSTLLPKFDAEAQRLSVILLRWMAPGFLVMAFAIAALAILTSYKVFSYPSGADATQKLVWALGLFMAINVLGLAAGKPRDGALMDPGRAIHIIGGAFLAGSLAQAVVLLIGMRPVLKFYRPGLPALSGRRIATESLWIAGVLGTAFASAWAWTACARLPEGHALHVTEQSAHFFTLTTLVLIGTAYALMMRQRGMGRSGLMARFAVLASPLLISVIFGRYRTVAETFFQTYTEEGGFAMIEYAKKMANLPTVLIGYALSIAMIPYLCDLAAEDKREQLAGLVARTLRFMALIFLPMTTVAMVLSRPAMRLLWDWGKWSEHDAQQAGLALAILAVTIFVMAMENVLMQSFFSIQRTGTPTVVAILVAILHAVALYLAIEIFGLKAHALLIVCLTIAISRTLKNLVLLVILNHNLGMSRSIRETFGFIWRIALICAVTAIVAWIAFHPMDALLPLARFRPDKAGRSAKLVFAGVKLVRLAAPTVAALIAYVALCFALRMEELTLVADWIRPRLKRFRK